MSRFVGGEEVATATGGAGCAEADGLAAVDAGAAGDDADAADDRADDGIGTLDLGAPGTACVRACTSGAALAGVGAGLPLSGASLGVELTSDRVGSGAGAGGAIGALATIEPVGIAGSAFVGAPEGGPSQSPDSRLPTIAEPPTANTHQRAGRARRFIVEEFTQSRQRGLQRQLTWFVQARTEVTYVSADLQFPEG
jgi:hypothetical protein